MSDPSTRPSELTKLLDNDREFKLYMIDHVVESKRWREGMDKWREKIDTESPRIISGVNNYNEDKKTLGTIKSFFVGLFLFFVAIGGAVVTWFQIADHLKDKP